MFKNHQLTTFRRSTQQNCLKDKLRKHYRRTCSTRSAAVFKHYRSLCALNILTCSYKCGLIHMRTGSSGRAKDTSDVLSFDEVCLERMKCLNCLGAHLVWKLQETILFRYIQHICITIISLIKSVLNFHMYGQVRSRFIT